MINASLIQSATPNLKPFKASRNKPRALRALVPAGLALAALVAGCATKPTPTPEATSPVLVTPPALIVQWTNDLKIPSTQKNPITKAYVRDDKLFVYTKNGKSYVIDRATGLTSHLDEVPGAVSELHPPVVLHDWIVYPTTTALEVYDKQGGYLRSIPVQGSVASDAVGDGRVAVYVAVEIPGVTRVCKYDMRVLANQPEQSLGHPYPTEAKQYTWALQAYHGNITAAPAFFADAVYVAGTDGLVTAVSAEERSPMWPIQQENTPAPGMFDARSPIQANLSIDESGLFVPALEGRLYCINRISGQVKWQYFASGPPLENPAILTSDTVYLQDPSRGIVAIDKIEPPNVPGRPFRRSYNREPRWASTAISQILAQDDHYTFAARKDKTIVALDKTTGEPAFASNRNDFTVFATNTKDAMVYAVTRDGKVVAIKAVTVPGVVGELAMAH